MTPETMTRERLTEPVHPRHEKGFADRVLWDLIEHANEYRPLGRLYADHVPSFDRCTIIREAVNRGRRLGFVIEGDRRQGYRLIGFKLPDAIYLVKPGDYQRGAAGEDVDPDQLTLGE